jgi:hypothetical protein
VDPLSVATELRATIGCVNRCPVGLFPLPTFDPVLANIVQTIYKARQAVAHATRRTFRKLVRSSHLKPRFEIRGRVRSRSLRDRPTQRFGSKCRASLGFMAEQKPVFPPGCSAAELAEPEVPTF